MKHPSDPRNELLERAITSLRDVPVPPGPAPLVRERTIRSIAAKQRAHPTWNLARVAAAVLLLIGGMAVVRRIQTSHRQSETTPLKVVRSEGPSRSPSPNGVPKTEPSDGSPATPAREQHPAALASNIAITGRVFYLGPRPQRRRIDLAACPQCASAIDGPLYEESLVVNGDGSLRNVVVSVSAGLPADGQFASATAPVTLDQKGCTFRPHVIATRVGQPIVVKNSDPFLHTVRSLDAEEFPAFNFAQPTIGQRRVEPLRAVETFQVKCDLHPWMNAWVRVFVHPYFAVTGADGSFALPPLPPGTYRVKAWHETLGVREKTVEVRRDRGAVVDLTFDAR